MHSYKRYLIPLLLVSCLSWAYDAERGVMITETNIFVSPDIKSQKLGRVTRGREVVVLETSHEFLKVFAALDNDREVTGWILDKGVVRAKTPNGDRILFGEGVDSENEASRRGGRKGADLDAMRLYYRMAEYFPNSPMAGEALWRAADIRWQLEKQDVYSRKSSKEQDAYLRGQISEEWMKEVQRKFPNTKWADLAAYSRIDNKVCGEWQSQPKCPENESEMYEKYAREHPTSPKAAEALYEAAWRQSALIEIYRERSDSAKSGSARAKARALAQNIVEQYAQQGDWPNRAQRLIYMLDQGLPTFGAVRD